MKWKLGQLLHVINLHTKLLFWLQQTNWDSNWPWHAGTQHGLLIHVLQGYLLSPYQPRAKHLFVQHVGKPTSHSCRGVVNATLCKHTTLSLAWTKLVDTNDDFFFHCSSTKYRKLLSTFALKKPSLYPGPCKIPCPIIPGRTPYPMWNQIYPPPHTNPQIRVNLPSHPDHHRPMFPPAKNILMVIGWKKGTQTCLSCAFQFSFYVQSKQLCLNWIYCRIVVLHNDKKMRDGFMCVCAVTARVSRALSPSTAGELLNGEGVALIPKLPLHQDDDDPNCFCHC